MFPVLVIAAVGLNWVFWLVFRRRKPLQIDFISWVVTVTILCKMRLSLNYRRNFRFYKRANKNQCARFLLLFFLFCFCFVVVFVVVVYIYWTKLTDASQTLQISMLRPLYGTHMALHLPPKRVQWDVFLLYCLIKGNGLQELDIQFK